ncbi:ankyrin repeat domain-containing protein, partial [Gammaproteobacteria bacterium]|nr:ankyrin repeat domain-containing protein [Gammaproteobacteria bacterium]
SDSLLIFAVTENNTDVVELLLENGANPNYKNVNGINALTAAVHKDNPQIATLLLRHGIKPDNYFWSEIRHSKPSTAFIRTAWNGLNKGSIGRNIIIGTKTQNVFSGDGLVLSANGDRYEGQLNNSQMHGKGKFTLATGFIYEGDFLQGKLFNGQIDTGGKITKIANGKATLSKAEKSSLQKDMNRLKVEGNKNYKRAMTSSNNSQVVEDIATIGVGIVGFAIMLPLMIIEEILSGDVLHEVAKDLPAAYFENKRQQQVIRNAYVRGANSQRALTTQPQPRQPVRNLNNRQPCVAPFC